MTIRLISFFAFVTLLGAAVPAQAQGLQGQWRNTNNNVHLRVTACGDALCGTVTWAAGPQRASARKGSGRELVGSILLRELKRAPDGSWRGKVYVPDINSTASATVVQVNGNLIRVSGCTLLGLACKTQHWHRLP